MSKQYYIILEVHSVLDWSQSPHLIKLGIQETIWKHPGMMKPLGMLKFMCIIYLDVSIKYCINV